jgi:SAM-dependent methyltransferase
MNDTTLSEWLGLREAADARSRSAGLVEAITSALPKDRVISVLDLGTGTGSNFRYLVERLPPQQRWLAIDRSDTLLRDLESRSRAWALERGYRVDASPPPGALFVLAGERVNCCVTVQARNLNQLDDHSIFDGRDLVTASALLDLVSEEWLRTLAQRCRQAGAAVLISITYDGRFTCHPQEPEDEMIRRAMNLHQRRDKGLGGPAQGPHAARSAEQCFAEVGYHVMSDTTDWVLGAEASMQRVLVEGWAQAALDVMPAQTGAIRSWQARRLAHIEAGRSRLVVGHRDLAAWPA